MSTPTTDPIPFDQKYHFLLRKLHSLTGIVPVGVFLIEHMFTNSMALKGPDEFNRDVEFIHGLPYLLLLEIFGIFLPLAFHAVYGITIALSAESNSSRYPYLANRRYTLQRVTGYIAFVFVIVHLLKYRFAHLVGWGPDFMAPGTDFFEVTRRGLMAWRPLGIHVASWITLSMYVVGVTAAVYHFCNGIWSFCISWGITVGERAQQRVGYAATAVAVVLLAWGYASLYAFATAKPGETLANRTAAPAPVAVQVGAPR